MHVDSREVEHVTATGGMCRRHYIRNDRAEVSIIVCNWGKKYSPILLYGEFPNGFGII